MQTAQMNPPGYSYQPKVPPAHTLDELRVVHDNYDTAGSFSAKSMRPVLITAVLIAAVAGIALGLHAYSENTTATVNTAALGPDPSVPAASSVKATSTVPAPTAAPTAKDTPATDPLGPLTTSKEANSMPLAGHGNNHSSESMNPAKAKSSVAAKSAAVSTRRVAPTPATVESYVAPTPQEAVPAPSIIEEKAVAPAPAPVVPPVEAPKQ